MTRTPEETTELENLPTAEDILSNVEIDILPTAEVESQPTAEVEVLPTAEVESLPTAEVESLPTAEVEILPPDGTLQADSLSLSGLSDQEVSERIHKGQVNTQPDGLTPSVGQIIRKNVVTLFNIINVVLAVILLASGVHVKNVLFLGIAVCHSAMGIFQELRSKKTLDKLKILAEARVEVLRNGQTVTVLQEEIVLDDMMILRSGNQICADSIVIESQGMEVDEALLTGEADKISKNAGDELLSGSYVTSGQAYARVRAVGKDNYATALTMEAKKEKKETPPLLKTLNTIIRILTFVIIPLGLLLFYSQINAGDAFADAALSAASSMLGMIPEGLILLTGVTLTVGAMSLAKNKALVQSLPSIETLARVDVLCLDKTGTITDGTLSFEELVLYEDATKEKIGRAISEVMGALQDENMTAQGLKKAFGVSTAWTKNSVLPFSSDRKLSGASFVQEGTYIIGAPAFIFGKTNFAHMDKVQEYAKKGMRVLAVAHSDQLMEEKVLPGDLKCLALIVLSDTIRKEAPATFQYFINEGVTLKVISGDDALTVSTIASKAGLPGAENAIDMSEQDDSLNYSYIVDKYTVFGRVSPKQKKELIRAIKLSGHVTCMTGDGVNDVPAMKEANCSVAMVGGSDAARSACDFVLMDSNFSSMVNILKEGRRVINNIERVSALYLIKTIYSVLLTLIFIFLPCSYPFLSLQLTPINVFTTGVPSFILALRQNYQRPSGKFLTNVLEESLPAALTVVFNVLVLELAGTWFDLTSTETSTMQVLLTATVSFVLLERISHPLNTRMKCMLGGLLLAVFVSIAVFGDFFLLGGIFNRNIFFYLPLMYTSPKMFMALNKLIRKTSKYTDKIKLKLSR